jgi:hypothetical protein
MRTGTRTRVVIRPGDMEFIEKNIRHLRIIMLPGMDKDLGMILPDLPGHGSALDELGACPDNRDDLHVRIPPVISL